LHARCDHSPWDYSASPANITYPINLSWLDRTSAAVSEALEALDPNAGCYSSKIFPAWLQLLETFQHLFADMAPQMANQAFAMPRLLWLRSINTTNPRTIEDYLYLQWHNPGDILSLLLILGPEIVTMAVGQLAGRIVVPIAFSFGWVAYAVGALLSTVGGAYSSR
jgi:hypothetical protein